jgi:predicted TIM-barrel fold metal-dependent hydrolase
VLPDDTRLISVDDHIIEHRHVWQDRLPARFRAAGPHVVDDDGIPVWVYEDRRYPPLGLDAVAGDDPSEFKLSAKAFEAMRPGCYDPVARLADMDEDGVWAQLGFPQFPRFAGQTFLEGTDHELGLACVQAWNDFVVDEWCAADRDRLIPMCMVPLWDPVLAAGEVSRMAGRGARAITFSENPAALGLPSFWSDAWDPFLSAAEDADMPLCLHIGSSSRPIVPSPDVTIPVVISLLGLLSMSALADLVFSPVFERHPRLKVVFSEGGVGWMPYMLERLEQVWHKQRHHSKVNVTQSPRECFRDHIWGAFISDEVGVANRHEIGVDKMLWESDYPHSDTMWPNSRATLAKHLVGIPDDEARRIAEGNARALFRM